ncbi:thiamine pyrophosphate enzyme, N-terminal TPP binding domain-containing protein [Hyaloraphidium curvatum]|nr:thiamine pyrophosphate enzyme, N-terminal TPP binding domain-containing protein [Hyaloraphidium curvatum]
MEHSNASTDVHGPSSVGEALVHLLRDYGVTHAFGIPGVHNVELYRALPASGIKHVLARHEQGAAFMADGFTRASGRPGVAISITGPGVLNALTGLAQAYSDSSPVLLLSSSLDIADSAQGRGRLHEMRSQRGAAAAVTEYSFGPTAPADVEQAVAAAFAGMKAARPRPAYIELPIDVLGAKTAAFRKQALPRRAFPDPGLIEEAAALLSSAERPIIVFGGGAVDASAQAVALVDRLGCPVLTTVAGKGVVSSDHPLCLGARMPQAAARELLSSADVVLVVGSELAETDFYSPEPPIFGKHMIRIDLDPAVLARPYPAEVAILADASAALSAILAALPAHLDTGERFERSAQLVKTYLDTEPSFDDPLRGIMRHLLAAIRAALPQDCILATDMTQPAYAANEIFPVYAPRTYLHPVGFGTLGFALPAAIGASLARPGVPAAVLVGDYGFGYTLPELSTAAELGMDLAVLVWDNSALGEIRDDMVRKGIEPNAVRARNPDFEAVARGFGCDAERPGDLEALGRAIGGCWGKGKPTVIVMTPEMVDN